MFEGNEQTMQVDTNILMKISQMNKANPYVDVTPYELEIGLPLVSYTGFFPQAGEILVYAAPASTFVDKEKVVGYTGRSAGTTVRVAKGLSVRTGGSGSRAIRDNVRTFHEGDLLITNKRVMFIGKNDHFEFKVNKISLTKPLDKNSFVIQSGKSSKNISLDELLTGYALGFVNYVVNAANQGADVFQTVFQNQNLTPEQKVICDRVKQDVMNLSCNDKTKKESRVSIGKVLLGLFVAGMLFGLLCNIVGMA